MPSNSKFWLSLKQTMVGDALMWRHTGSGHIVHAHESTTKGLSMTTNIQTKLGICGQTSSAQQEDVVNQQLCIASAPCLRRSISKLITMTDSSSQSLKRLDGKIKIQQDISQPICQLYQETLLSLREMFRTQSRSTLTTMVEARKPTQHKNGLQQLSFDPDLS